jgi:hypothetical protein
MMKARNLLPLSGIVFVVLVAVAVAGVGGSTPDPDASAAKVMSFYSAHQGRQIAAAFVLALATPFLVAFAVALASSLWRKDERPVWELVLLVGSALAGTAVLVTATVHVALADGADKLSANGLQVLNVIDGNTWVAFNAGLGVMMLGAAGSLLSRAAGSRWLARTALALGVLLFIPFADFFAMLATGLWILAASIALVRRERGAAYSTAPATA